MYQSIMIYFLIINIVGLSMMFIDKEKAKRRKWRIRESSLLLMAFLGGSIGIFISMKLFHHKTKTPKFYIGVPLIILIQIISLYIVIRNIYL